MRLVLALLALLTIRHYGYESLIGVAGLNAREWFYVLGGFQEAILWLLIAGVASMSKPSLQRSLGILAGVWGFVEGAQMSVCRFSASPSKVSAGQGLCDIAWGIPMYALGICVAAVIFAFLIMRHGNG